MNAVHKIHQEDKSLQENVTYFPNKNKDGSYIYSLPPSSPGQQQSSVCAYPAHYYSHHRQPVPRPVPYPQMEIYIEDTSSNQFEVEPDKNSNMKVTRTNSVSSGHSDASNTNKSLRNNKQVDNNVASTENSDCVTVRSLRSDTELELSQLTEEEINLLQNLDSDKLTAVSNVNSIMKKTIAILKRVASSSSGDRNSESDDRNGPSDSKYLKLKVHMLIVTNTRDVTVLFLFLCDKTFTNVCTC